MSDNEVPDVTEIKARLAEEIPVEEEELADAVRKGTSAAEDVDVSAELRNLGRQLAETFKTAWASEERKKVEGEIRQGVKTFVDEMDKAIREVSKSSAAQKVREEAAGIKTRAESGELSQKTKANMAQGLHWLSEELEKLANQFTPTEKQPPSEEEM
jgi:hypothetical protein